MCSLECGEVTLKVVQIMNMVGSCLFLIAAIGYLPFWAVPLLFSLKNGYRTDGSSADPESLGESGVRSLALSIGCFSCMIVSAHQSIFLLNFIGYQGVKRRNRSLLGAFLIGYYVITLLAIWVLISFHLILVRKDKNLAQDFRDYSKDANARMLVDDYQRTYECCGSNDMDFIHKLKPLPSSCCRGHDKNENGNDTENDNKNDNENDNKNDNETAHDNDGVNNTTQSRTTSLTCNSKEAHSQTCQLYRLPGGLSIVLKYGDLTYHGMSVLSYSSYNKFGRNTVRNPTVMFIMYVLAILLFLKIFTSFLTAIFATFILKAYCKLEAEEDEKYY